MGSVNLKSRKPTTISIRYNKRNDFGKVISPDEAAKILRPFFDKIVNLREESYALMISRANTILGVIKVDQGTVSACMINYTELYSAAILSNASSVILAHNHPSGNLEPSQQDKKLTVDLKKGLDLFKIDLIDHLIITENNHRSFIHEINY